MLFGAKRERFVSNADVNQMTLPFEVPEETAKETELEKVEYLRTKPSRETTMVDWSFLPTFRSRKLLLNPKKIPRG
jgi:hypothetical protein